MERSNIARRESSPAESGRAPVKMSLEKHRFRMQGAGDGFSGLRLRVCRFEILGFRVDCSL